MANLEIDKYSSQLRSQIEKIAESASCFQSLGRSHCVFSLPTPVVLDWYRLTVPKSRYLRVNIQSTLLQVNYEPKKKIFKILCEPEELVLRIRHTENKERPDIISDTFLLNERGLFDVRQWPYDHISIIRAATLFDLINLAGFINNRQPYNPI